jgi:ubiquinone/menaquinone biosynthesis C-methylase UbiE
MSFLYYLSRFTKRNLPPMTSASEPRSPSPQPIFDAVWGFAVTRVLTAAVDLDLFTAIARGHHTIDELAKDRSCSRRGLSMLLHALTALNYLDSTSAGYDLRPVSAAFLSTASPHYMGTYLLHNTRESWVPWAALSDVVRRGEPARQSVHGDQADPEFFAQLVDSLHALSAPAASIAARALDDRARHQSCVVLDVGAGSAVWSLALARQNPQTRVTVVDLPGVLDTVTRRFVAREGLSDRFAFWPGDLHQIDFGESAFDAIVLGHICHGEGAARTQELLHRAFRALRPGGQILIAEFVPDDDRKGPVMPLLFALHMLVLTDCGDTFTLGEFTEWLTTAGFVDVGTIAAPAPSPLIVATKR